MSIEHFTEKYCAEVGVVAGRCVSGAMVSSQGGRGYAIVGTLPCGLWVGASNGEMEGWGDDQCAWSVGLYHCDRMLAYLIAGPLADQMRVVAALTDEQARILINHDPAVWVLLPPQIIVCA